MTHWIKDTMTLLAATLLFAACGGMDDGTELPSDVQPLEPQAIGFSAYVNRGTTRGGYEGPLDTEQMKTQGFGVFAYYTDDKPYHQMALPNFMYNQQVTHDGTRWVYSPVKYWPNETGATAKSDGTDRLSFFAYAPYTAVDAITGCATERPATGIVGLSRSTESGDPYVRYRIALTPAQSVDLCRPDNDNKNETKPDISTDVSFTFKHALSALNVQIDADIDAASPGHAIAVDANTRIWVRSVVFEGFADQGQLNLNTGQWNEMDCDCDLSSGPITVSDGRRDGHEGMAASPYERPTGLNPTIVQSCSYADLALDAAAWTAKYPDQQKPDGVTNATVNLFDPTGVSGDADALLEAPIYVIPTNDPMRVTITYDVETIDPKLVANHLSDGVTNGSSVENTISSYINNGSTPLTMEADKQYNIRLHLGMRSVKVTATVTPWADGATAPVYVPEN